MPILFKNDHQKGLLVTSLGVLCLTPDALLVRLIHTDPWTLLFWRGILMSLGLALVLGLSGRRPWRIPLKAIPAGAFLALSTICFVNSLERTQAANTLVILATAPLLAAILSWIFLREKVQPITTLAILMAGAGIALSLLDGHHRGSLEGEFFAGISALGMAAHFTALRWWRSDEGPKSVLVAGGLLALVTAPLARAEAVPAESVVWLLILGLLCLPTAFGLMAIGPRYLPAPEVGLLLLGETVLGPFWVWLALSEVPGPFTITGALVVVLVLAGHSWISRDGEDT